MPTTDASAIHRKIIGVLLQGARLKAGRAKKECADVIGVTPETLSAYEEGSRDISLPELELLAYYLHVPVTSFLEGDDDSLVNLDAPPAEQVMALRHRIIGLLLRQAREQKGKSLESLADVVGGTPQQIIEYETGATPVPFMQLKALADELGLSLSHFMDEGVGKVGARQSQDHQYKVWQSLPEEVRDFVVQPTSVTYLRVAMHLAEMPADTIRKLAGGLLEITF